MSLRARPRLRFTSWVAADVLSLRSIWGTPPRVAEGILQTLLQGQEGLAGGDLGVAPPRVAENQLEQQMSVGLAGDGHLEFHAVGEVNLGLPSRRMHLGEVHLLVRTVQRPPPEPAEGPVIVVAGCAAGMRAEPLGMLLLLLSLSKGTR